jgi:hypothetical protein
VPRASKVENAKRLETIGFHWRFARKSEKLNCGLANRRLQPLGHLSTQNSSPLPDQSGNCDWGVKIGAKIYPKPLELSCFKQGSSLRDWPIVDRMGNRIWETKWRRTD